jgi:hypothetical protein
MPARSYEDDLDEHRVGLTIANNGTVAKIIPRKSLARHADGKAREREAAAALDRLGHVDEAAGE